MKVAYYSPFPPERTGISEYSALLVPALRGRVELDVAKRGGRAGGDIALYHVGNNPEAHGWILDRLRAQPGVVVLHDFVLHHLVAGTTLARRDGPGYLAALEREGGVAARLLGLGVIDGCIPPLWEVRPEDFPLVGEVLPYATGLVVHSRYVEDRVRERGYAGPVWRIPHPAWPDPHVAQERGEGEPLYGVFGNLNPSKRVGQLLEGFARFREAHPAARLVVVGAAAPGFDVDARIEAAGVEDAVTWHDYVDEARLWALMSGVDAVVTLRSPTMGETSGTAVRALTLGKPLVVSDVGWFTDLSDDVAIKVAPDEHEPGAIAAALERLAAPDERAAMSAAARGLAEREHSVEHVAELYVAALEEAAGGGAVRDAVLHTVTRAAADVGIDAESPAAARVGRALDEVEL
jgi:glycosyltransferase involved in cell wall biosynthesis